MEKSSRLFCSILVLFLTSTMPVFGQVQLDDFKPFLFEPDGAFASVNSMSREKELDSIIALQENASELEIQRMNYWNASYPSYRWHQIMMEVSAAHEGHKNGGRVVIMHLAIYDALAEVWQYKKRVDLVAPFEQHASIEALVRTQQYSSRTCEWSAAAGAAREVIGYYFPERISYLDSLVADFKEARLRTGLQFSSDIETGYTIGKHIGKKYIEYAKTDRTDQIWDGEVPNSDSLWSGTPNKWGPMKRHWKPLALDRADQFRPGPPPTDWTKDMEELRNFNATHTTSTIAWKWKSAPVWDDLLERKILEYDLNPFEAAYACAVHHTARFDGIIAAWDGKYHYWGIRPFQYDPDFEPILVATPNFPGYPAGHTTVAGSISTVLSYLFPQDADTFEALAKECSESRFEGGVHFRTDNEVGLEVGAKVGGEVIKAFSEE